MFYKSFANWPYNVALARLVGDPTCSTGSSTKPTTQRSTWKVGCETVRRLEWRGLFWSQASSKLPREIGLPRGRFLPLRLDGWTRQLRQGPQESQGVEAVRTRLVGNEFVVMYDSWGALTVYNQPRNRCFKKLAPNIKRRSPKGSTELRLVVDMEQWLDEPVETRGSCCRASVTSSRTSRRC